MVCGLVQSYDQFLSSGCPNCESFLSLRGNVDRVLDSTAITFMGLVGMVKPKESWVARWQGISGRAKGMYAARVRGQLTGDVLDICDAQGIRPIVNNNKP